MVTDRKIIVSNGSTSMELTRLPCSVEKMEGFDRLEVQNVTSQGWSQDGASLLNSYVLARDMSIVGRIKADTTYQMQMLRDKLSMVFLPKREVTINHYYGGVNRIITACVEKTPKFSLTDVIRVQEYEISLLATEPYWRDETETLVPIANVIGHFHFPLIIPKDKGVYFGVKNPALIVDVYSKSSIRVGMRFEFIANGEVTNPQLFNVNTREYLKLLCTMEAGEKITVETGLTNTVIQKKSGIEKDYIGKIDLAGGGSTFLQLEPGDNLFRYAADGGENFLEVRIYYYNKYPGV